MRIRSGPTYTPADCDDDSQCTDQHDGPGYSDVLPDVADRLRRELENPVTTDERDLEDVLAAGAVGHALDGDACVAQVRHQHLRALQRQCVSRLSARGAGADDDHVVLLL